jgi:hypothetical protein
VPEISRFFGIVISMFVEVEEPHHRPHFHAFYQGNRASFGIDSLERLAGSLPRKQERLVLAWAEIHQAELRKCWDELQAGRPSRKIEPLR